MTDSTLPSQARVVVVGGGIMGCSTAYHLTQLGWRDVVLLEQAKLTSGSTWHAAGLVGQLRAQAGVTQLLRHSVALYQSLEAQTGLSTGWKMSGGLRLACNPARMIELQRQATTARSFGLDMHLLSPSEALALWPAMRVDNVVGATFLPSDGQANPADITQALAKAARHGGATLIEDCRVTKVRVENSQVRGVDTVSGKIDCEIVVNCCGQWARQFAAAVGVSVPLVPVRHQYLITEAIDGLPRDLPTLRDPDYLTYYKEEVGGLVMGGYEPNPVAWGSGEVPADFSFSLLDSDWNHFEPLMKNALRRVPALEEAGVKQLVTGPESFTPDGNFILGGRPSWPVILWARGSILLESPPVVGPGEPWRRGSSRVKHLTICGRWTSDDLVLITGISNGIAPARSRCTQNITLLPGPTKSTKALDLHGALPYTIR